MAQLATLAGCADPSPRASVTVETDPASASLGAVRITGHARALLRASRSEEEWRRLARITVGADDSMPPLVGRYEADGTILRFVPRYPLSPGLTLRVRLDSLGPTGSEQLVHDATLEAVAASVPVARVVAVHPVARELPANQLRWYVEFSHPMREDEAAAHVTLQDERGAQVEDAFLRVEQELWDASGRRLTLFFDPGRVKRGIGPNERMGRPLVRGRAYTIRIDSAWRDARNAPLIASYSHTFRVTDADHERPDPRRWGITVPRVGTKEPLRVAFGEVLDHALAERLIAVVDPGGVTIRGRVVLANEDREWQFEPDAPWRAGDYALSVSPDLEDVAGNSVRRVFDAEVARDTAGAPGPIACVFSPAPRANELVAPRGCAAVEGLPARGSGG